MIRRSLLLAAALLGHASAVHYFKGFTSKKDMELNRMLVNGLVARATLLAFHNNECVGEVHALGFPFNYADLPDSTHELAQVHLDPQSPTELATLFGVADCKTFVYLPPNQPLSAFEKVTAASERELEQWFWARQKKPSYELYNDLEYPVDVGYEARRTQDIDAVVHMTTLEPGERKTWTMHRGHWAVVTHHDEPEILVGRTVVHEEAALPMSRLLEGPQGHEALQRLMRDVDLWRKRRESNMWRISLNENQPKTKPVFAPVGFKKMRLPEAAWKVIREYHDQTKERQEVEALTPSDIVINCWEVPTSMNQLPESHRQLLFDTLKPILEDWSGVELEQTACYGIRKYTNGSWLREHVDRAETHIVSAILNIESVNLQEDWLLQILDHDGVRHHVPMTPGDIVLYESSSKAHGRPQALLGEAYYNAFTHFRPVDPKLHKREAGQPMKVPRIQVDVSPAAVQQ